MMSIDQRANSNGRHAWRRPAVMADIRVFRRAKAARRRGAAVRRRPCVQISASQGQSKNYDFGVRGMTWGDGMAGGASAFTSTNAGKVVLAAFVDSYNGMVRSLRNYRTQTVEGGLGAGGRLGVQGGQTDASMEVGP